MPPKRHQFTNLQRVALRQHHAAYPLLSQRDLCQWFEGQFGQPIRQVTVSETLSTRYASLDDRSSHHQEQPQKKKQRKEQWIELEGALAEWLHTAQYTLPITGDLIRLQASYYWHRLPQYQGIEEPSWSNGWLQGFKHRKGIKERRRFGEAGSVDLDSMAAELAIIKARIAAYSPDDQYNCDETGLFWKSLPDRGLGTVLVEGTKQSKARITLHFCTNASGSHKLAPWIIGQYLKPRCFRGAGIDIQRLACTYRANKKAWMNTVIMEEWLRWFDSQMTGRKVVLLMDNFSAHQAAVNSINMMPAEFGLRNTEIVWLPPNTTSKTQPLDQGIIRTFKALYRKSWLRYMLEEHQASRDPLHTINLLKAIRFVLRAWGDLSIQSIAHCWDHANLRLLPAEIPSLQGTRHPQEVEVIELIQQQLSELLQQEVIRTAMSIEQLLLPQDEVVHDDPTDVAEAIAQAYEPVPIEESDCEEGIEILPRITARQAIMLLSQLRLHEEQSDDCNNTWLRSLDQYEQVVRQRQMKGLQQQRLDTFFI